MIATLVNLSLLIALTGNGNIETLEEDGSPYPRKLVALEQHLRAVIDLRKR